MSVLDRKVSFFEQGIKQHTPTLSRGIIDILKDIKSGKWKKEIEKVRSLSGSTQKVAKAYLPWVSWSGVFKYCKLHGDPSNLIEHSGIICIDVDDLPADRLITARAELIADKYTLALFTSPSGNGLKLLVEINGAHHAESFAWLEKYYLGTYAITIDKACKDITRACFISYDTDLYVNGSAEILVVEGVPVQASKNSGPVAAIDRTQLNELTPKQKKDLVKIELIANQCHEKGIDITANDYNHRLEVGFCMATFGEAGRDLYHRLVQYNDAYEVRDAESKFENALKTAHFKTPAKIFTLAKQANIIISTPTAIISVERQEVDAAEIKVKQKESVLKDAANANRNKRQIEKTENYLNDRYDIRNNIISNEIEISGKGKKVWEEMDENNLLREFMHNGIPLSQAKTLCLLKSDFVPKFNPFEDYFKNLPPYINGVEPDYLDRLAGYVSATNQVRFNYHFKRQLVRLVGCAIDDHYYNKHCFNLISDEQHIGKTSYIRFLVPKPLREYYAENPVMDKDGLIALRENILINFDELANIARHEINQMKAFMSKFSIKIRPPFEKRAKTFKRVASFFGSTNRTQFLSDETGSVRWLNFKITSIDFAYSTEVNIDDCYRQALYLYNLGPANYILTKQDIEENEKSNQDFQTPMAEMELVEKYFYPGTKDNHDVFMSPTEITAALSVKIGGQIKLSPIMIGRALSALKFTREQKFNGVYQEKGYYIRHMPESGLAAQQSKLALPVAPVAAGGDDLPF